MEVTILFKHKRKTIYRYIYLFYSFVSLCFLLMLIKSITIHFIVLLGFFVEYPFQIGGKSYKCTRCGRCYTHSNNLRRHIRFECGKAAGFQCLYCTYKVKQKHNLYQHVMTRHSNNMQEFKQKFKTITPS